MWFRSGRDATFFAGLQPTIRIRLQQILVLFTLFFLFVLLKCHETLFLQRVALRRIASLASCTHSLFRVLKKVDEAVSRGGNQMSVSGLYIQIDERTLWTTNMFKEQYNHYRDSDNKWSKPFNEWKKWFVNNASFISLEQFLENNWLKVKNAIDEKHTKFIKQFQNGESKSKIFLNYVYLFDDLDTYLKDVLWIDIDEIREISQKYRGGLL